MDELPPLPRAFVPGDESSPRDFYVADQMQAYARQAVAQAVAEEREAVAAMVADLLTEPAGQRIAAIIRRAQMLANEVTEWKARFDMLLKRTPSAELGLLREAASMAPAAPKGE